MISSPIASNKKMNRYPVSDHMHRQYHPPRRITDEQEPTYKKRYASYLTELTDSSSRTPLDSTFIRTVSRDDALAHRFEPPTKKPKHRYEGRDDTESSVASQNSRGRSYRNPTMKSYTSIESLINGAYDNRDDLVASSLSAFWTRAASLLEEENNKSSTLQRIRTQHLYDKLVYFLRRTEATLEEFGSNNCSQTLTALGKIYKQGRKGSSYQVMFYDLIVDKGVASRDSIFLKIANVSVHRLDRYDPQALATTAITFARIGVAPTLNDGSSLFDHIAFYSMRRMRDFNPQAQSTLVWAFSTVQALHKDLFNMVANRAQASLRQFNPQNLSNMLWAFAKVNKPNPQLFKSIAIESIKFISSPESCPQNIANTLWSFATVEMYDKELFDASAKKIIDSVSDFNPQELANSANAFASFDIVPDHALFTKIGDEATRQISSFTTQNMANISHAFAVVGVSHHKLFDSIASEAMCRLSEFNAQEIANLTWSFAKAKEAEPKLYHLVAEEILSRLDEFVEPQHLSNTVWAFATAKLPHKPLFEATAEVVIKRKHEFSPQQVSNLIWSYSYIPVGSVNQLLCRSFEQIVFKSIDNCDPQFFANIAWSYAVANVDAPFLFGKNSPFIHAILSRQHEFNLEALCQLHQFILWRKELKSYIPLPFSLQKLCFNSYIAREPSPSAFQDHVISEIKSVGLEPKEEYLTSCGYSLDALVEIKGEQVGIEVDGPFHFAGKGQPLGKMTLKHRQVLSVTGIRIISIPYWEWEGTVDKQVYLRSKLGLDEEEIDEFRWIL